MLKEAHIIKQERIAYPVTGEEGVSRKGLKGDKGYGTGGILCIPPDLGVIGRGAAGIESRTEGYLMG